MKGKIFIVSAPGGAGKTTLVKMLVNTYPDLLIQSISCTTRLPRRGEIDGKDYVFLTKDAFAKRVQNNEFLEHTKVFGNDYGTLKKTVEVYRNSGRHVILVIDTEGAKKLKDLIEATLIFIYPPSITELKQRLKARKTESSVSLKEKLDKAAQEVTQSTIFDYKVVNNNIELAFKELSNIILGKKNKEVL